MKIFLLKTKRFIRRNIYPITVVVCTALMISLISISAYTSINSAKKNITNVANQKNYIDTGSESGNNGTGDGKTNSSEGEKSGEGSASEDETKQTASSEPIIFGLPFENATISKEYAEDKLLYDKTTNFWCTHQGLDFACKEGQRVYAVADGTITKIESSMMNGTVIYLKVSEKLTVVYKGLSSNVNVKEGDSVKKGKELGSVTSFLAEKADGIHLHLELISEEKLIDPTEYVCSRPVCFFY